MKLMGPNNPKLKIVSQDVEDIKKGIKFGKNLLKTLNKHHTGVGLAAVQVGYMKRIFVIRWKSVATIVINPIILKHSLRRGKMLESCLTFPGKEVSIRRSQWIDVFYINGSGEIISTRLEGMKARIFQHEFDHLNGICRVGELNG